ncbi:MAG TPA: hypothetical protein PLH56_05490, partial [Candidatus Omnitrophota bacterium]|nr:hypothetical protein [Candidatus Omnitrophota bacterium]
MIYSGDDWSYFAHSSAIAFGQFPHYDKEVWHIGQGIPFHPSGPGVLASPFVFLFSLIDRLSGSDIVLQRTAQNIPGSWSLFGFTFATVFYFLAGCSFLFYGLKKHVSERSASWAVILMVVLQGAPLFAFRRPVFSHIYEFFIQSFLVFILLTILKSSRSLKWKQIFFIGLAVGLTILVRYNNIFMALAWPVIFAIWGMKEYSIKEKALRVSVIYFMAALLIIFFKFLPEMFVTVSGVDVSDRLLGAKLFSVFFQRLGHIFIGLDWGLIYTAPFLLIGLICLCFIHRATIVPFRWLSLLLLVNFAIIMQWMTQGGWYGYR